jgi:hypothetical protein
LPRNRKLGRSGPDGQDTIRATARLPLFRARWKMFFGNRFCEQDNKCIFSNEAQNFISELFHNFISELF